MSATVPTGPKTCRVTCLRVEGLDVIEADPDGRRATARAEDTMQPVHGETRGGDKYHDDQWNPRAFDDGHLPPCPSRVSCTTN